MGATSQHFTESELACPHCGVNGCTQALVDALELFRAAVGKPVLIDSAYRCPEHNAGTPNAAKNSVHMQGEAADIRVAGMTARELEAIARTIPAIRDGGIGVAPELNYIHIDVRDTAARWAYDAGGKTIPYYA